MSSGRLRRNFDYEIGVKADLYMAEDRKNTANGSLFAFFDEPDTAIGAVGAGRKRVIKLTSAGRFDSDAITNLLYDRMRVHSFPAALSILNGFANPPSYIKPVCSPPKYDKHNFTSILRNKHHSRPLPLYTSITRDPLPDGPPSVFRFG